MKVAVVVGHHKKAKGAYSKYLQQSEWDFYTDVVAEVVGADVYFHDENISGYVTRQKAMARKLNEKDYGLVMELHFNAASPQANGCETLYYFDSKKGLLYAQHFSELVVGCTGIKKRGNNGAKALLHKGDRGFHAVYQPKAPAILIEPFFGSNEEDCKKIIGASHMASIINDFIAQI